MNNLIKTLIFGLLSLGLANCGGGGGGGGGGGDTANTNVKLTGSADAIIINDSQSGNPVEWSNSYNNIYINVSSNGLCVTGLAQSADDTLVSDRVNQMQALLNSATVLTGTGKAFVADPNSLPSVTVKGGGSEQVYYLVDASQVPASAKTLSNYNDILNFYDSMIYEINQNGTRYCPGKGDNIPSK